MHPGSRRSSVFASILAAASLASGLPAAAEDPLDPSAAALHLVFVDLCDTRPRAASRHAPRDPGPAGAGGDDGHGPNRLPGRGPGERRRLRRPHALRPEPPPDAAGRGRRPARERAAADGVGVPARGWRGASASISGRPPAGRTGTACSSSGRWPWSWCTSSPTPSPARRTARTASCRPGSAGSSFSTRGSSSTPTSIRPSAPASAAIRAAADPQADVVADRHLRAVSRGTARPLDLAWSCLFVLDARFGPGSTFASTVIGQTLSHYEVLEKIGEGGMGVVYKARDTLLDRLVALKTLPSGGAADPDRQARLLREARAASALHHPNIVAVHDLLHHDGSDVIVMELVTGRTLDRAVAGKPLREVLGYARQIADALAKAHAAGIVHRDLKPSNVMVDESGTVRILDFGLARLGPPVGTVDFGSESASPTAEATGTADGRIVGTLAYMSPEQAEGKKADARSDVFSFGAVLYEMVTGRMAFRGDSAAATLAAVLEHDPPPPRELVPGLPPDLEKLVQRCLRKDPAKRFQSMGDVALDLDEIAAGLDTREARPPRATSRRRAAWLLAGAALPRARRASSPGGSREARRRPPAPPGSPSSRPTRGEELCPTFSPDGTHVAFAWNGERQDNIDIYVKARRRDRPAAAPDDGPGPRHLPVLVARRATDRLPAHGASRGRRHESSTARAADGDRHPRPRRSGEEGGRRAGRRLSVPLLDAGRPVARDPGTRIRREATGSSSFRWSRGGEAAHLEPGERRHLARRCPRTGAGSPTARCRSVYVVRHPRPGAAAGSPAHGAPRARARRAGGWGRLRAAWRGPRTARASCTRAATTSVASRSRGAGDRADRAGRAAGRLPAVSARGIASPSPAGSTTATSGGSRRATAHGRSSPRRAIDQSPQLSPDGTRIAVPVRPRRSRGGLRQRGGRLEPGPADRRPRP